MRRPARRPHSLWLWLLIVYALLAGAVLLAPVSYGEVVVAAGEGIRRWTGGASFGYGWVEFAANVALFVPLGALLTLLTRRPWHGAALALALSVAAELTQLAVPGRVASPRDVLANVLGATLGAGAAWLFVTPRRARRRATTRVR